jgi:hypothetical protein
MDFLTTPTGVPIIIDGEHAIPLTRDMIGEIGVMDADEDGFIDTLMEQIKESVFTIAGIDPTLGNEEWWTEWVSLMTVLQFSEAINVLREASMLSAQLRAEEASA